ncbi:hypothetical protein KQI76_09865 [Amphibacillus sp. MSJ-3]|uniref:DUF6171 family protein n=1 Tax=Amphibacillus sp. MSJ-3 TaxID=2841505 RepID=UPI001C0EEDA0|nr:DUF6171 family protein [Amphibacillus sp. MSJ-3]MBU5595457.1 hypothetical protein [Amphibacillus sp. MSJ-3]
MTCKGCSVTVRYSPEEVEALVKEQLLFEEDLVDESIYQQRIAICQTCPHLQYETTCGFCGCFIAFRARLANKRCPDPSGMRWNRVR